jgi:hypothetical protein
MPLTMIHKVRRTAMAAQWEFDCDSCLALLVLALGAESFAIEELSASHLYPITIIHAPTTEDQVGCFSIVHLKHSHSHTARIP